ncbi:hypothetical protein [Paracoccus sp. IB05]|uniref:hypothetical protein n=1 Tax=Paracoccus sp. IB05 TaxID=2779367 RepID=UPI0018E7E506|nr:hypothetical protein [Paracoccus sp. IB05]MBJ2153176.1 hypothetical protein [Paracoccus sp. IB05]
MQADIAAERKANFDAMIVQIRRAASSGHLPPATDARAVATMFNTFLLGIAMSARDGASREELEAAIELAMKSWPDHPDA